MNISRRSFLKIAGLSTVAAAGAVMFSSCSVAAVLQITNEDGDIFNTDAGKAQLDQANKALKLMPIPFVNKIKVSDVEDKLKTTLKDVDGLVPDGKEIYIKNANNDGYIEVKGDFIGTLTIDLALRDKKSGSKAQTLSL